MYWYLRGFEKYAVFSGRARRKEYWMFLALNVIVALVLHLIDRAIGFVEPLTGYGPLYGLYTLAIILPFLSLAVRRLHDTNRTGWWLLIGLVPFFGAIVLLYFYALDSQPGPNAYGPNPKAAVA